MSKFPSFRFHRDFSLAPKVHLILLFFFFKERKKKRFAGELAFTWRSISLFPPCLFLFFYVSTSFIYMTLVRLSVYVFVVRTNALAHPVTFSSQHPLRIFTVCTREREKEPGTKTSHCIDTPLSLSLSPLTLSIFPFCCPNYLAPRIQHAHKT